jgi:hypothetical protein
MNEFIVVNEKQVGEAYPAGSRIIRPSIAMCKDFHLHPRRVLQAYSESGIDKLDMI